MAVTLAFQPSPQKRRVGRGSLLDNGLALADLPKLGAGRRSESGEKQTVHIRGFPVLAMAGNSHLLIFKDFNQHKREMQLASAFSETTKLAKRVRELEDVDAELEEYRQVLRTAISFQRRRKARCRLASISEED
ncbi:g5902 [Coccomyxa elongata]